MCSLKVLIIHFFFFHIGTSEDWAKGAAGIKYSYAVKLRDRGSFGFLLPAVQILPTAKEIFVAIKVLAKMIKSKY